MKASYLSKYVVKLGKFLLVGLLVTIGSLIFLYPQLFYCQIISFSDFLEIKPKIYFSPEIEPSQYPVIKRIIKASEMRVDSFYSGKKSSPILIICSNPEQYQKYCSSTEGAGCSLGTPWGSSFIIVNARGINTDVVSHEMSHIELLKRLGWWKTTMQIPQWFNEGIALMLDKRFVNNADPGGRYLAYMDEWMYYTGGGQEIRELNDLATLGGFFNGSPKQVMLAYMTSGMEIAYWLVFAGDSGVQNLILEMNRGLSFSEAYKKMEEKRNATPLPKLPSNPLRFQESKKISE